MRKNKVFYVAVLIIVFLVMVAIFAPLIAPYDPQYLDISLKLKPPSAEHIFGTDHLGRDVFSRLIYGTRISLLLATIITVINLLIAFPIGLFVGYKGGRVDKVFSWFANIIMAFPSFLLSMSLAGILGQGVENIVIAVTVVGWVYYARIIRNMVFNVKNNAYVKVAVTMGAPSSYIIRKHIFPFVFKPILVIALSQIGSVILMISGFSFLGIGVQPNVSEWGMMLNDARPYFRRIPMLMTYPGMAILLSVLAFNLIGDNFDYEK